MDTLKAEHEKLLKKGNLNKSINDVQKTIDLLVKARAQVAEDPASAQMTLAKLQAPAKQSFEKVNDDLKEVHQALGKYGKALDKQKFKDKPLPEAENDALSAYPSLVNRAIAMHLLREGQFGVASTFIDESKARPPNPAPAANNLDPYTPEQWEKAFTGGHMDSGALQQQFADMYHILHELKQQQNLQPAIAWSRQHSAQLEARGSNLEFELCRLQYVCLFMGHTLDGSISEPDQGPLRAWAYARSEFGAFQSRYSKDIQQLVGAMAFWENMSDSPYKRTFYNEHAFEEVASSFTREFCSLLGLSADSPLYIAATAGAIALPTLLKLRSIMREKKTEWTSQNELPVEIPLPPSYYFHSIFVCPVSKEQTTDQNPPMMMPCGHVIAKESLDRISKGARFKCPYCPGESHPRDAKKVFL
ncbi:Rmnd5a protein [Neofusicoccum parvum]|uniref:GID complex catalytic subunit 2 n=2 Tax=Neofusicoccum parvum TaxID=310453 RepID=R1EWQ2_BOTPV|nr:putative regulator of gluconeogenesis protein [Neofusicoccum parvum UCRNP2]GME24839.1 Rmnd5a protein [Neofusicoccum parvum]GME37459.1 Rmnd5a protein [Neofusicoccum parvum]